MLRGEDGNQREEVGRLVQWLRRDVNPDVIVLTNLLIAGPLPAIRRELPGVKVVALLQGDDVFLDHLPPDIRREAIHLISERGRICDAIVTNSHVYAQRMSELLSLVPEQVRVIPLAIDTTAFEQADLVSQANRPPTIGYFARISPEKGLHHLVDAFIDLSKRSGCESVHLHIAGWLGSAHRGYFASQWQRLCSSGLQQRIRHLGSPDLAGKIAMLRGIDVLSVPTEHEEPKGLFVLEALALGIPVVQLASGAFPEIVEPSGGGVLVPPRDPRRLADALEELLVNPERRRQLGAAGRAWVLSERTIGSQAASLRQLIELL
jgi:glycosyltransferase involved in cell wall biosynthesis